MLKQKCYGSLATTFNYLFRIFISREATFERKKTKKKEEKEVFRPETKMNRE